MAIQYYMRAFNTTLSQYVDWVVNDAPDSTGVFSGYPTNQLIDITVNRIVQSKIGNILKQNQGLGGSDGYYYHVNSYDWKNAVAPIGLPSQLTGLAVERGLTSLVNVTGATNASPIQITTATSHGLSTGQYVTVIGVQGNTNANGTWSIVSTGASSFTLTGSIGNGTYTTGGAVYVPTDFSTLTWDEAAQLWRFVLNTKGDGTTLGTSQSVKLNNMLIDGYQALGTNPASQGIIRLPNNQYIFWRNGANNGDVQGIGVDALNRISLGALTSDLVYVPGSQIVDGYIARSASGTASTNVAQVGFIRDQNARNIIAFRKADQSGDIVALSSTSGNLIVIGDAVNLGTVHNTSTGNVHQFQVNSANAFEIGSSFARFTSNVTAPTITQTTPASGVSGQTLLVQAQNGGTGTTGGGILSLTSGTGSGTGAHGTVLINTGSDQKVIYYPTNNAGANSNSILYFSNLLRVDAAQTSPRIRQDDSTTASAIGQAFTVQSQNTTGATSTGGALNLTSGTGTSSHGRVNIQTGGTTQIIVSPTTIAPGGQSATTGSVIILGNLEVVGTTTTVDSTVVDIIGRVIHANWSDPSASPNTSVPSQIVGYSVHRGNSSGLARDGAAWIWTEGAANNGSDGYWRAATNPGDGYGTDNFTIANSTNSLGVMGNHFTASPDPNPVTGTLPGVGGLKTPNNVTSVAARNLGITTTIASGSNLASLPQSTINVASVSGFSSTGGTLLIATDSGMQTVTYTAASGGAFTGCSGGTGTMHTGGIVGQTNNSTTIASGSNGTVLPQSTINVVSTAGFPTAGGTLRIVSSVSGVAGTVLATQTITYSSISGNSFTGCSGGTGTLFTGNAVSSLPVTGTADMLLLGTDFGNRILHGAAAVNTGHIFNTSTGGFYDFWVNSVPQVKIAAGDPDADGYAEVITIQPTVSNPRIYQIVQPDTGANNGFAMVLQAQDGQAQTGANANNSGGKIILASGSPGTGGSGSAGVQGTVDLQTGTTLKMRVFPTTAASAADNNSILFFENLFRVDTGQTNPLIRQDDTTGTTGQKLTIQAQNATGASSTGGDGYFTSGTGTSTAGNVHIQTGGVSKIIVRPSFTEFRDTAEALRVTPVSAGTTQITFASTVTAAQINQTVTTTAPASMTIQSQATTGNTLAGSNLSLIAGNSTGTTTLGGDGYFSSGTGTTSSGNIHLQTGGVDKFVVHPSFAEFRDTAEAYRITPLSAGATVLQAAATVTGVTYKQADNTTNSATAASTTVQAQNATGITANGGNLNLTSGSGTALDGYLNLQAGGSTTAVVHTNKFTFSKGRRRHVTQISSGSTYAVLATDDYIAITTLTAAFQITLPASPVLGDAYEIKDTTGNAAGFNVTVSGNGNNIDGFSTFVIAQAYGSAVFTYTGTQWSIT